jgi:O-antigen ligase
LNELERMRGSLRLAALTGLRGRDRERVVVAAVAGLVVLAVTAFSQHAPYDIHEGTAARIVAGLVPPVAGAIAAWAILRPWPAFVAVLLLTPVIDVAQVSVNIGPIQVISQTLFGAVLVAGVLLLPARPHEPAAAAPEGDPPLARRLGPVRLDIDHVAGISVIVLLAFAAASTILSPDRVLSATILLHGIVEPAVMGLLLIALRPTKRQLVAVLIALCISVAIGGFLDMVQSVPAWPSLAALQLQRLYFSRINYFNVGLFGEMLALALPLFLVLLIARHRLNLGRGLQLVIAVSLLVSLVSLFLTFSKSDYVAALGSCVVLVLLVVESWRRRIGIVLALGLVSTVVIPWPAFFLQVAPPLQTAYKNVAVSIMGQSRYNSWDPSTQAGTGSLLERWYATRAGLEMAVDHPIFGIGLDQFKGLYVDHYRPPEAKLSVDWAHSMLPEVAAELGIPALLLEMLLYALAFLALWRVYRAPPDPLTRLLAAALLACMVAWQVVGLAFAGDMYRPWRNMSSDYVMMMVLLAAAFVLYRLSRDRALAD